MPPINVGITMPREMTLSLIGALQLMAHAECHTKTRKMIIEIGRILQDRVCDAPELYLIIDTGWPDMDPDC